MLLPWRGKPSSTTYIEPRRTHLKYGIPCVNLPVVTFSCVAACQEGPTSYMNEIMTRLQDSMDFVTGIRQVITKRLKANSSSCAIGQPLLAFSIDFNAVVLLVQFM